MIATALALALCMWRWLNNSVSGKLTRALMHDREMSEAFGMNVAKMYVGVFVAGSMLGALGGALTAPKIAVSPGLGVEVIVLASRWRSSAAGKRWRSDGGRAGGRDLPGRCRCIIFLKLNCSPFTW